MKLNLSSVCAIALAGLAMWVTPASAQSYTFSILNGLDGSRSFATGINNAGQVAGYSGGGAMHATLWNSTTATDLGTLGGVYSYAFGINNAGQVVGIAAATVGHDEYATLWNGTTPTVLVGGPDYFNDPRAINDAGQVVGMMSGPATGTRTTLWYGATATDLGPGAERRWDNTPVYSINNSGQVAWTSAGGGATLWNGTAAITLGGTGSSARGINNAGQVVGYSTVSGNWHATLWDGTGVTDLGPGWANAINNAGQMVGYSTVSGNRHATLWNGTTAIDLNSLLDPGSIEAGWVLADTIGINDQGAILGEGFNSRLGQVRSYVLTPVPEPETYAMLLAGLGLIGAIGHRRRLT